MKNHWFSLLWLGSAAILADPARLQAQAFEVVAHPSVSVSTLDKVALKDMYLGKTAYWTGGDAVVIVLADKTDAALQEIAGMSGSQFKTHWQRLVFSGRGKAPKDASDAAKAVTLVAETKGSVALVPAGTDLKGVKKLELK